MREKEEDRNYLEGEMKQTVAVIGSLDTKSSELAYMVRTIRQMGKDCLLIDTSGLRHEVEEPKADITNQMLLEAAGTSFGAMEESTKQERLHAVTEGLKVILRKLYKEGRFQGVISAGGMQNTLIAKTAMMELPFGVPKVNVAPSMTVVEVDDALGRMDDAATVNSFADIGGGINSLTAGIIKNGIAALVGMMEHGSGKFAGSGRPLVGITNLGVTAQGASKTAELLNGAGIETCMFHGTMHGAIVEKLVREGILGGVMMLCVHDILTEAIGAFQFCKIPTLQAPAEMKIPTVVSLSGMDVIDMSDTDFRQGKLPGAEHRKHHFHNEFCVHVKASEEEILKGGRLLAERLNAFTSPVTVVIPLRGFRTYTQPGEPLYDPGVDGALIRYLHENLKKEIKIVDVDANANDWEFSRAAAEEMRCLMG